MGKANLLARTSSVKTKTDESRYFTQHVEHTVYTHENRNHRWKSGNEGNLSEKSIYTRLTGKYY